MWSQDHGDYSGEKFVVCLFSEGIESEIRHEKLDGGCCGLLSCQLLL